MSNVNREDLPIQITLGDRVYEVFSLLREGEVSINGHEMKSRASMIGAKIGEDEGRYIDAHSSDIPDIFWGSGFVFTEWRMCVDLPEGFDPPFIIKMFCLGRWGMSEWDLGDDVIKSEWGSDCYVLRRIS
jgi:hypothetical protein